MTKSLFPAFLKLEGRPVLVVGAGKVGEQKIEGLLATGARITVVALATSQAIQEWALEGALTLYLRAFQPADLDGSFLVIAATSSRDLNKLIFREAHSRGVLCNVVDVPELCDFFYPAVVRRGDLQIAISTSGQSPSLAQRIRKQLEQQFGANYAQWVEELGSTRRLILASNLRDEIKRDLLHSLASRDAFEERLRAATFELRASDHAIASGSQVTPKSNENVIEGEIDGESEAHTREEWVARSSQLVAGSSGIAAIGPEGQP